MSELFFTTEASKKVFEDPRLPEPKSIWNYFLAMVETPRGSGYPDKPRERIISFGKAMGLETEVDEVGNVMIRKPATPGYEDRPGVCLQVHYDMVTVAAPGVNIDFTKDPLVPRLVESPDKKFGDTAMMATGTSLGADDGIGDAIVLAILADKTLKHGPIEGLFTMDEETTMHGATNVKPGFIHSPYLINVDSEESWRITIGCAGGFEEVITVPLARATSKGLSVRIELSKLQGGHSGVEIHKGLANSHQILAQVVNETIEATKLQDCACLEYFVGGDKRNVIPNATRCGIQIPADKKEAFLAELNKQIEIVKTEWKTKEPTMEFVIKPEDAEAEKNVFDKASTRHFLDCVLTAPHGVLRWSPDVPDLVETSINFAKVVLCDKCADAEARFEFFPRSSDNEYMPILHRKLEGLARLFRGTCSPMTAFFPGWLPDTTNPLLTLASSVYKELNGSEAEIYAIHAGLECGMFQKTHPTLKCISVGPYLIDVHSPKETLFINTAPETFKLIAGILERLK